MELEKLDGNIIGVISKDFKATDFGEKKISEIIVKKVDASLKMVKLDASILDRSFKDLSLREKQKVILASKLHDNVITLVDFKKGLLKKDLDYFKGLFKKIVSYNKKIILIDTNLELFLNCVDVIYVILDNAVKYKTKDLFDRNLEQYGDLPKLVSFTNKCDDLGIRIDHYQEIDELLKAIYRIKS